MYFKIFTRFIVPALAIISCSSCSKDKDDTTGIVTTDDVMDVRRSSVYAGGIVAPRLTDTIVMLGFCWNTTGLPTVYDDYTINGNQGYEFNSRIHGLKPNTMYHLRAYLSCPGRVFYGNEKVFRTMPGSTEVLFNSGSVYGSVSDIEGNQYKTIELGGKTWMAENLRTAHFNDGTEIPLVEDNNDWKNLTSPAVSWCENNEAFYKKLYGGYYNWYAVNTGKLCPTGWHVSSDAEWKDMEVQLGMSSADAEFWNFRGNTQGKRLKEAGTNNWVADTATGSNETGFTALPGGKRSEYVGAFEAEGSSAYWWTSEDSGYSWAVFHSLWYFTSKALRNASAKYSGYNVRCIKD